VSTWTQNTGTGGKLELQITETGTNAAANTSSVHVLAEIYTPAGSFHNGADLSVSLSGDISWSTGSWSFDSSGGWHTLYSGTVTVDHAANGTGSFAATFSLNDSTGTSGVGGPASVHGSIGLTTLTVAPGTPTALTATRVSDSQINLAWTRHYASNGVPTDTNCQKQVDGGSWQSVAASGNVASMSVAVAANQKLFFEVQQSNSAGSSAWSAASAAVWTTPAAPSVCAATKQSGGAILVSWTNNAAYAEYGTEVWHGTVSGGTTTWDSAALATAASGATSYTDAAPDPSKVHVYQVRAKTTSGAALYSGYAVSNSVQLLTAPNAPTVAALPQYADKAQALEVDWTHNPVDSTAETAYEVARSTDGGTTWTTTGKTAGTVSSFTIAASTYAANAAVTIRVRTWGEATTGGSDGTGGSPWSSYQTVTFKSAPTLSITAPTAAAGVTQAHTSVTLAFAQPEGATFVSGTVTLLQGATVLETDDTTATSIPLATRLDDGATYTVQATATDSNGLTATAAPVTFAVNYASPAPGTVNGVYVPQAGMMQLTLTFPAPVAPEVAAATYTVTRTIAGAVETIMDRQPVAGPLILLDTTPTINGTNHYELTTYSSDGSASAPVIAEVVTTETMWAFLSTGDGFADYVTFYGNLNMGSTPARDSALIKAAGRSRPIALFGPTSTLDVAVSATLFTDEGSTPEQVEAWLLNAGIACYRDPSGRRMFGLVSNTQIANRTPFTADLSFTVSEAQ
jgi:hypothetical protein